MAPSGHDRKIVDWDVKPQPKQTYKQIIKNEMCCSGLASFSTTVSGYDRELNFAIENNQYVNGSTDTDAGADSRLIIRFVIFFLIIFVEVCIRCIYM